MSSTPFMQLYVGDYLSDTLDLSTVEHGAYLLILMTMWRNDASLPNDAAKLARIARMTPATFKPVWAEISRFFVVDGDSITNPRMTKEHKKASKKSEVRAAAGSAGGKAKALKNNNADLANATVLPKHSSEVRYHKEEVKEEAKASLSSATTSGPAPIDEIATAVSAYNIAAADAGWPEVRVLSKARRSALKARLKEAGGLDGWQIALAKARASPHCCGQNDRGWVASFDFLTSQSSFAKLMEGNYDRRQSPQQNRQLSRADASNLAIAVAGRARPAPVEDWL